MWPEGKEGKKETKILKAGDLIEIPTGIPHSLCCDKHDGLQVHSPHRARMPASCATVSDACPPPDSRACLRRLNSAHSQSRQFHELVGEGTEVFAKRATTFLIREGFERPKLAGTPSP